MSEMSPLLVRTHVYTNEILYHRSARRLRKNPTPRDIFSSHQRAPSARMRARPSAHARTRAHTHPVVALRALSRALRVVGVACALFLPAAVLAQHAFDWPSPSPTSRIGALTECVDGSRTARRLCGAIAAVVREQYVYVVASRFDGVAVVDAYRPEALNIVGHWASFSLARRPKAIAMHVSSSYVVVLAYGDSMLKKSAVLAVNVSSPVAPENVARFEDCGSGDYGDGRRWYNGTLCGASAMAVVGNTAFVVVGDTDRLTAVKLLSDVSRAGTDTMSSLGSIQSEVLRNARAIVVENSIAYIKSDGVCTECVAVVDVSDPTAMVVQAQTTLDAIASTVPAWRWMDNLARGAHRDNSTFPYDWVVDPVYSSITSVARECIDVALEIGDSPSACVSRNEFSYDGGVAESDAYAFTLES